MKKLIKQIVPPVVHQAIKSVIPKQFGWFGDYKSWHDAEKDASGYDSEIILRKVESATKKVILGEAAFERDSVTFAEHDYNWPFLAHLFYIAARNNGHLRVLDFGGSLGSSYYQNRNFLSELPQMEWSVIEQEHFVKSGQKHFSNDHLKFYHTVDSCIAERARIDVLLFSSVLQYIKKPYQLLDGILNHGFEFVLIDRMPFNTQKKNRICVQKVPKAIYPASYPCHLLNDEEFIAYFQQKGYRVVADYDALDGKSESYHFKGILFEKQLCD